MNKAKTKGMPLERWLDADGKIAYIRGGRANGRLTRAEFLACHPVMAGTVKLKDGTVFRLPITVDPATAHPYFIVVQAGGSTGEFYAHDFETEAQGRKYMQSAAKAAYNTTVPIKVPGVTDINAIQAILDALGELV